MPSVSKAEQLTRRGFEQEITEITEKTEGSLVLGKDVTTDCPERQSHNHRTKEQRTLTTDCTDFTDEKLKILFEMKDFFLQWYGFHG